MIESYLQLIEPFAGTLMKVFLHSLWQGIVIAIIAGIVLGLLKDKKPQSRYLVSCFALLLMCVSIIATEFLVNTDSTATSAVLPVVSGEIALTQDSKTLTQVNNNLFPVTAEEMPWLQSANINQWLMFIWLAGVLLLTVYHVVGWRGSRKLVRTGTSGLSPEWERRFKKLREELGINRIVTLLTSTVVQVPCVVGWTKPVVLMPISMMSSLSPEEIEMILVHELAHVRRHDFVVNLLQAAMETIFFFNPAVWWLSRQIRIEREHCCDDAAIALSGDRLGYARALTNLEELTMFRTGLVSALTGTSLAMRVHRILKIAPSKINIPGLNFLGIVTLALSLVIGFGSFGGPTVSEARADTRFETLDKFSPQRSDINGDWEMENNRFESRLKLWYGWDNHSSLDFNIEELFDELQDGTEHFQLVRNAGTFFFRGKLERDRDEFFGEGEWYFQPNEEYVNKMEDYGLNLEDSEDPFKLAIFDVSLAFVSEMESLGYRRLDMDELLASRIHDVTPEFIRELDKHGYQDLDLDQLVTMKIHDVTPESIEGYKRLGLRNLSIDKLVAAHIHDVTPEFIAELEEQGLTGLDIEELVAMKIHDVDPEFIKDLDKQGYRDVDIEQLVSMKIHDVNPRDIREFERFGLRNLSIDDLVAARIHDVTPEFIEELEEQGLAGLDMDELVAMRIHGVDPAAVTEFRRQGFRNLSPDKMVTARIHNVTPEFIEELEEQGLTGLDMDELVAMKIHNVNPRDIREFERLGIRNLSADQAVAAKIHGVTPEFVDDLAELGYSNLKMSRLVDFRIHKVTTGFIRELAKLGFENIRPSTLVKMRIHDVSPSLIRRLQKKGYDDLTPRDLIDYQIYRN